MKTLIGVAAALLFSGAAQAGCINMSDPQAACSYDQISESARALDICSRHIVWNMPTESGAVTAPSAMYLREWNDVCMKIEAIARAQALRAGAERDQAERAFVDSVIEKTK